MSCGGEVRFTARLVSLNSGRLLQPAPLLLFTSQPPSSCFVLSAWTLELRAVRGQGCVLLSHLPGPGPAYFKRNIA